MSDLRVNTIGDSSGSGPVATLPTSGGSAFTLGPNWGVWEFVSTAAITATTNLDVTSLAAGYDYLFSIRGGVPDTDGTTLRARISQSAAFNTGASYADAAAVDSTSIALSVVVGNVATEGVSKEVIFFEPNVANLNKAVAVVAETDSYTAGFTYHSGSRGGQFVGNTNACDGIRFFWSSGDWQALGDITVFRRRLS